MVTQYREPGVDVMIERSQLEQKSPETQFYPVFMGTGITSRNRSIQKENLRADTSLFPKVKVTFDLLGSINTDLFSKTKFTLGQVIVTKATLNPDDTATTVVLEPTTDYTLEGDITFSQTELTGSYTLNILNTGVAQTDVIYELNITASNVDNDFDLRAMGVEDRFYSKDMFGPIVLTENGEQFFNDIAIAAEIAFRMQVPRFYYLEVPRDFGKLPEVADYQGAIEKIYYFDDAYRIIPLTSDSQVAAALNDFVSGISNPMDRRETVGFVSYETSNITDFNNMDELIEKVGGYSVSLNNKRISNVFGGTNPELVINGQTYVIPDYFIAAAVACLDAVVGKVDPLSLREINIFSHIDCPRFRPRQWNELAQMGVFIVKKDNDSSPAVIRHQLTTAQTGLPEDQEYSVVKNFDVVTKKIRDRFKPYAGEYNIEAGYLERLEGTMATVRQEIIEEKLAKNLTVITPWALSDSDGRNLVTRLQMDPVFPANHLDVYLII